MQIGLDTKIEKPTVLNLLKTLDSGLGLDISKNHTGVTMWCNGELTTHGFKLSEYDKSDPHAEYRMRMDFKGRLLDIIDNKEFEYCAIEDVYGGENYDTVRKLLAIQTVIDELIFEGRVKVKNFYRWLPSEWLAKTRLFYKQSGKLKSKLEVQGILDYLEFDFYQKYKDYPTSQREATKSGLDTLENLFFEDICDSCGILLATVVEKNMKVNLTTKRTLSMKDVKVVFLEYLEDVYDSRDSRLRNDGMLEVNIDTTNIEYSILTLCNKNPKDVMYCLIPTSCLGTFGIKNKFKFFEQGDGYLIFYNKVKEG